MEKIIGTLQSVQVGSPNRYPLHVESASDERSWETSFFRAPSPVRRRLSFTHLDGNEQADKKNHGSPDQVVLMYGLAHYPVWRAELGRPEMGPGAFAENFTIDGMTEADASAGDIYQIGDATVQVAGPRYPCTKIARRWGIPYLTARVGETGRTGWYCRVLEEGWIEPGLPIVLVDRPYPEITMALLNEFGHGRNQDVAQARQIASCPLVSDWWGSLIVRRAQGRTDD